jgi:hypothetical protein
MDYRVSITYPRNWTETKNLLRSLDRRWEIAMRIPTKHHRMKEWINLSREANIFYKTSKEKVSILQEFVESIKDECSFADLVKQNINLNFHKRNVKIIEEWMMSKKMPIRK